MWVAKKPELQTAIDDIDKVIDADNGKVLTSADKSTIEDLYRTYDGQNGFITDAQHKSFDKEKAKQLHGLYGKTYIGDKLDYVRKELFATVTKCPYCSISAPETLDHYMPEADYGELAVCRLNLVPMCYTCNRKKKKLPYSDFVHPYYSGLPKGVQFFVCEVFVDANDNLTWKFKFDNSVLSASLFRKLNNQVSDTHTDALNRIEAESNEFVSNNFFDSDGEFICDEALDKHIDFLLQQHKPYGQNDWRNALLNAFKTDARVNAKVINKYTQEHPAKINDGEVI